ncbi:hypothetical protein DFS34DRAFT_482469 [Phlyctochytrium arcticum]|nr:hypothetical protein DFS34DRAFT_482469 [Phlyctochytrium arcticum]
MEPPSQFDAHRSSSNMSNEPPTTASPIGPPPMSRESLFKAANEAVAQEDGRISLTSLSNLPTLDRRVSIDSYQELYQADDSVASLIAKVPSSVPQLSIVIQIVGSRGDVQPFLALAKELQLHGHRVRIATHETFRKWVRGHNVEFYPLGADPAELMAFMVENGGLIPSAKSIGKGDVQKKRMSVAEILQSTWGSCVEPDDETGEAFGADLIIANPPSFGHIHCAERLGIPLHMSFTMPWTPTGSFPHPLTNIDHSKSVRTSLNYASYIATEYLTWTGLGDLVNDFRKSLGLKSMTTQQGASAISDLEVPYTYCWSPSLIPKPKDWGKHVDISGFYFLDQASNYSPPADLAAFLSGGPPPIYIGFGSVTGFDMQKLTAAVLEGVRLSGVRAIVSKGWAGLASSAPNQDPNIFFIGDCPHDWLFQNVAAVCHHGGAGTLSAGLRLGKPTIVVPFFGDQFFWGAMVYRMKAGPLPIPAREMTAQKLAAAIKTALESECVTKATHIAKEMARERGTKLGVASLHSHLPLKALHSDLNDTHAARYKIPRFKLQIHRTKEWHLYDHHNQMLATGAIKAVFEGVTGVITDTAKGVKSAMNKDDAGDAAKEIGKGFSKGVGKAVTFPFKAAALTYKELSDGMVRGPALWDPNFKPRRQEHITSASSGAVESGKALAFGIFDGIADFFVKPVEYAREEGAVGFAKGFAIGTMNFVWKPAAGALKMVECMGTGLYKEATKKKFTTVVPQGALRVQDRNAQSDWTELATEMSGYTAEECMQIVSKFKDAVVIKGGKGRPPSPKK